MDRVGVIAEADPAGVPPPLARQVGLAVASGLGCAAAFPPWDLWPAGFVGLVPLFLALEAEGPQRAAWLGFISGMSFYLPTIWWVINAMISYGRMPLGVSFVALPLLCGVLAGYAAVFAWLLTAGRQWLAPAPEIVPLLASGLWTALEFLRTHLLSGFPWALLGYSQYPQPTIRLMASVVGVYGISALLVLLNATLAGLLTHGRGTPRAGWRWRGALLPVGLAALSLLAAVGYGRFLWRDPTRGEPIRIGVLQGNIDQSLKWDRSHQTATLGTYERLVRQIAAEGPALIVWPETAVPFLLRGDSELADRVRRLVAEAGIPMLIGSPDEGEDGRLYNSAFLVGNDGGIRDRYEKRHLVPFGEYVPLKGLLFFLDKLVVGSGDFGGGRRATVFSLDEVRFGVTICYEVIFPAEVREFVRQGAEFLVNITNDAWFGRSSAPYQHLAMSAMRAVENGTYLVRAANTGISAVIAPSGQILAATGVFTEGSLLGMIRPRRRETFYTRHGDILAWVCLVFLGAYLLALGHARWSSRGTT